MCESGTDIAGMISVYGEFVLRFLLPNMEAKVELQGQPGTNKHLREISHNTRPNSTKKKAGEKRRRKCLLSPTELTDKEVKILDFS